jgi:hypothetical protein
LESQGPPEAGARRYTFHFPAEWRATLSVIDCATLALLQVPWTVSATPNVRAQGDVELDLLPTQGLFLTVLADAQQPLDLTHLDALPPEVLQAIQFTLSSRMPIPSRQFSHLRHLTGLRVLKIMVARSLSRSALDAIGRLHRLEILHIEAKALTRASLAPLARLSELRVLSFWKTPVIDEHLAHIAHLTTLQYLDLWGARIMDTASPIWKR